MSIGFIALILAIAAAGWLLFQVARGGAASDNKNITVLKVVVWLGLAAALFAAKLWPLAFMVLVAAGGVMAIEMWRGNSIPGEEDEAPTQRSLSRQMTVEEAAQVLGLGLDASAEDIRAAHRKLIAQLHPDTGGTDYLAAQINDARDLMLRLREASPD